MDSAEQAMEQAQLACRLAARMRRRPLSPPLVLPLVRAAPAPVAPPPPPLPLRARTFQSARLSLPLPPRCTAAVTALALANQVVRHGQADSKLIAVPQAQKGSSSKTQCCTSNSCSSRRDNDQRSYPGPDWRSCSCHLAILSLASHSRLAVQASSPLQSIRSVAIRSAVVCRAAIAVPRRGSRSRFGD